MRGQMFWYVFGYVNGRLTAQGPFLTENLAYQAAASITDWDSNDWKLRSYNTRRLSEAKSAFRQEQVTQTGELGPVLQPIRSTTTALKWKRKKDERTQRFDELKEERGIS